MHTNRRELLAGALSAAVLRGAKFDVTAGGSAPLEIDISRESLSRYGSYLAITHRFWQFGGGEQEMPTGEYYIRCLEDEANPAEIFRVEILQGGEAVKPRVTANPGRITFRTDDGGVVEMCIAETDEIRIKGSGAGLRLHTIIGPYANAARLHDGIWTLAPDTARSEVLVTRLAGEMNVDAPWVDDSHHVQINKGVFSFSGSFECSLLFYDGHVRALKQTSLDGAAAGANREFEQWTAKIAPFKPEWEAGRKLAAYVLWSSTVEPRGLYRRPTVWGSKNWATRIWSWDHCYAAMGLAKSHPQFAWQQFLVFTDMQDQTSGVLADAMSPIKRSWVCTKDPVHGLTLRHLRKLMRVSPQQLKEAYGPLALWTNYWVKNRDLDGDGLPCIIHADESFDNTTNNVLNGPVKPPEIATYLALQMEVLSEVARDLGYASDAQHWKRQSEKVIAAMQRVLWNSKRNQFVSKRVGDGYVGPGDCVLQFIPLLLGKRLPKSTTDALTAGLLQPGRFLDDYGFATEAFTSPLYDPNSYVKGPTWPPVNFWLAEALEQIGNSQVANQVRRGFLQSCVAHGMSEHFDAKTGEPGGDPGYIWTAALFLLLGSTAAA